MADRSRLPDYDVRGEMLVIGDIRVEFDHPIAKVVVYEGLYIVLLEYMDLPQSLENRNVIACTQDGGRVWQIEQSPASDERANPFAGLTVEAGELVGRTWRGVSVTIDAASGTWEKPQLTK